MQTWTVERWPAREGDEYKRSRLVILADGAYLTELEDSHAPESHTEQLAIAHLIAAAPALLDALRGIIEIGKRDMTNPKYDGYFKAALEAIALARKGE